MTVEQQKLCRSLIITPPNGKSQISKEAFLKLFPSSIEHGKLALGILEDAFGTQSAEDIQCALIVGFAFGFASEHMTMLCKLIEADWHYSHEDVVSALDKLKAQDAIPALYCATQRIPTSLKFDESRALAVKAIWALGKIEGKEAEEKLRLLAHEQNSILKEAALEQLQRRKTAL